jgi:hypothetical protein
MIIDPEDWHYDKYSLWNHKLEIEIWISNRPYADFTIAGTRLANRCKLRKALDKHKLIYPSTNL